MRPDKPFTRWHCDACGGLIEGVDGHWLEWLADAEHKYHGYKIVHGNTPDTGRRCSRYLYNREMSRDMCDMPLQTYLGTKGLITLLSWLSYGDCFKLNTHGPLTRDLREWVEIVRRLQLPYYEQARLYLPQAIAAGEIEIGNDLWVYDVDVLKYVIKEYGG